LAGTAVWASAGMATASAIAETKIFIGDTST
jgi:hypothetical protein